MPDHTDIQRVEATSRELHAIEYIAGLEKRFEEGEKYLEKRLRLVPDLYRQFRITKTALGKTLDGLYKTLDIRALKHMLKMCDNSEVIFRPRSVLNNSTDAQVVLTKDLKTIISAAVGYHCTLCLKSGKEVKKCELRKALMNIAPLTELETGDLCGYASESLAVRGWGDE